MNWGLSENEWKYLLCNIISSGSNKVLWCSPCTACFCCRPVQAFKAFSLPSVADGLMRLFCHVQEFRTTWHSALRLWAAARLRCRTASPVSLFLPCYSAAFTCWASRCHRITTLFDSVSAPVYGVQNNLTSPTPTTLSPTAANTHIGEALILYPVCPTSPPTRAHGTKKHPNTLAHSFALSLLNEDVFLSLHSLRRAEERVWNEHSRRWGHDEDNAPAAGCEKDSRYLIRRRSSLTRMSRCLCLTVRPSSPTGDEASGKDFKFVLTEKENAPIKPTERLAVAKDTGKQFMSAAPASLPSNTN